MKRLLTTTFRSVKHSNPNPNPICLKPSSSLSLESSSNAKPKSKSKPEPWCVYLILSTNAPFKTYVGVTANFSRRLRQHNGELKGGAKASRAGRPWVCACLVRGFNDQSEACEFESKWKRFSRKLPRKRKKEDLTKEAEERSLALLKHRETALNRVKGAKYAAKKMESAFSKTCDVTFRCSAFPCTSIKMEVHFRLGSCVQHLQLWNL